MYGIFWVLVFLKLWAPEIVDASCAFIWVIFLGGSPSHELSEPKMCHRKFEDQESTVVVRVRV